MRGKI